jgi:hypothetical protein
MYSNHHSSFARRPAVNNGRASSPFVTPRLKALLLLSAMAAIVLVVWPVAVGASSPTFETHISLPGPQEGYGTSGASGVKPDEIFVDGSAYPGGTTWRLDYNGNVGVNSTVCVRLFDVTANLPVSASEECLTGAAYSTSTTLPLTTTSFIDSGSGLGTTSTTLPPGSGSAGNGPSFNLAQEEDAYVLQERESPIQQPSGGGLFTTVQLVGTATASSPPLLGEVRYPSLMGVLALVVIGVGAFLGSRRATRRSMGQG